MTFLARWPRLSVQQESLFEEEDEAIEEIVLDMLEEGKLIDDDNDDESAKLESDMNDEESMDDERRVEFHVSVWASTPKSGVDVGVGVVAPGWVAGG